MTPKEFAHATMLVASLRTRLGHANALTAAVTTERDDLAKQLAAHVESLTLSNAQCAEYLRHNEKLTAELDRMKGDPLPIKLVGKLKDAEDSNKTLHSELVEVRAALAATTQQRDSLRRTLDEWSNADTRPHERIELPTVQDDLEFRAGIPTPAMLAVCSWWEVQGRGDVICFKNKDQRPVVWRSLRGDASWQYDDCPQPLKPSKRTWKQLDALLAEPPSAAISTHDMPPLRMGLVSAGGPVYIHDDVADHVVPPILHVGEPDPANDAKDAALEFRNVVPTPEMLKHVGYWDLVSGAAAIAFKTGGLRLVFWRISGSQEWRTDPCPQPLKPHGMTWQQLDKVLAGAPHDVADHVVPPVLDMCMTCHECGGALRPSPAAGSHRVLYCRTERCSRKNTAWRDELSPYHGPCKSATQVRHE